MSTFNYTIIIPHHNIPLLLKRCLESIPKRKDLQVIVIDDCSDESCKWIESYSKNWGDFIFIENKIPKGAGHARNLGLSSIKGKFVIFADCDDFFSADFSLILEKYKSSNFDLIFFNAKSVYSDNLEKESERANHVQNYINDYFINNDLFNLRYYFTEPWCKIIKSELILDNHIKFEETIVANDYLFSLNVGYFASNITVETMVGYIITLRSDSLSLSFQTTEKILARIGVSRRAYNFYKSHNLNCKERYLNYLLFTLLKQSPIDFIKVFFGMLFNGDFGQLIHFFCFCLKKLVLKIADITKRTFS